MTRPETTAGGRALSALELMLGAAIVIGHNVWRVVPNEVPILLLLGLASLKLRKGGFAAIGLARPESWKRIVAIALVAATLRIVIGELVVVPAAAHFWPAPVEAAEAGTLVGNVRNAALALLLVWTFAAFGEEFGYRGYLMRRAAEIGRATPLAYGVALVVTAALFGVGHWYKGIAGVIDSGFAGLVLGGAFLIARCSLWAPILAHGFIDTFAVVVTYLGWAD